MLRVILLLFGFLYAQSSFRALIQEGQKLDQSGNYPEAVAAYDKALGEIPGDQTKLLAAVHKLRAHALEMNKEYLQAIQSVQIALTYQKDSADLKEYLAKLQTLSSKSVATSKDIESALRRSFDVEATPGTEPGQSPASVALAVNFAFDKDTLSPTGVQQVNNLAEALRSMPNDRFQIIGHTDAQGKPAYNDDLSLRRAKRVMQELVTRNIVESRLTTKGMGSRQLVSNGTTEQDHARNRRVELVVMR